MNGISSVKIFLWVLGKSTSTNKFEIKGGYVQEEGLVDEVFYVCCIYWFSPVISKSEKLQNYDTLLRCLEAYTDRKEKAYDILKN